MGPAVTDLNLAGSRVWKIYRFTFKVKISQVYILKKVMASCNSFASASNVRHVIFQAFLENFCIIQPEGKSVMKNQPTAVILVSAVTSGGDKALMLAL